MREIRQGGETAALQFDGVDAKTVVFSLLALALREQAEIAQGQTGGLVLHSAEEGPENDVTWQVERFTVKLTAGVDSADTEFERGITIASLSYLKMLHQQGPEAWPELPADQLFNDEVTPEKVAAYGGHAYFMLSHTSVIDVDDPPAH